MANRYYGVIPNTPENKRILEITMALDARRNVTGEPTYLWKVPSPNERPTLKGGGYANDPAPRVLGGGLLAEMDERETMRRPRGMVSPYTQPPNEYVLAGTRPNYPYYNSVELDTINRKTLKGGLIDESELRRMGYRPNNLVMPKFDPSKINPEVVAYANSKREMERAKYRAKKLRAKEEIDGAGIFTAAAKESAKKAAKETAKVAMAAAKEAAKAAAKAAKEAAKIAAKAAKEAAKLGVAGAKEAAKGAVALASNKEFQEVVGQIAADKDVQKLVIDQITNLVKPKPTEEPVTETPVEEEEEEEVEGGRIKRKSPRGKGKTDGRAKRALIVKKVMQEKGLKMIEASKYVKVHKLY